MTITTDEEYEQAVARIAELHRITNNKAYNHPIYGDELADLVSATVDYERREYAKLGPIIGKCRSERAFEVEINQDSIEIIDGCDGCFGVTLTKSELLKLIAELQAIADKL